MSTVSIIIPTLNRTPLLERCLSSISRETDTDFDIEIIVIDDGSHADVVENNRLVCNRHHAVFIQAVTNHGMAVARNQGIAAAHGDWIVFLDDDVAVDPGWCRQLYDTLQKLPADAIGFEGRINTSGNGVWDREVSNTIGGAYLTSHLGIRKTTIDKCGGFDPAFEFKGPFCEDHELAARALQWGTIPFISSLSVTHAPRRIHFLHHILTAPKRCRSSRTRTRKRRTSSCRGTCFR